MKLFLFSFLFFAFIQVAFPQFGNDKVIESTDDSVVLKAGGRVRVDNANFHLEETREVRWEDTTGGEYVGVKSPGTISSSYTMTWPTAIGSTDDCLTDGGSGVLAFADCLLMTSGYFDLTEISSPGTPASGFGRCYYDSTAKQLACKDDTGTATVYGSGGGGGLDVFYTENFELNTHSILTSGNNATFDNGGTLAATLSTDTTTELSDLQSFKVVMAAGSLNDWIKSESISIFAKQSSINIGVGYSIICTYDGAAGDLKFLQWDDTNNTEISSVEIEAKTESTKYTMSGNFPSSATSVAWGIQVLVANSGKILICDDIEYTTDLIKLKNLTVTNSIKLENNDGRVITAGSEDIHFSGSGTGWTSAGDTHFYTVQKDNSVITISLGVVQSGTSVNGVALFKNNSDYKAVTNVFSDDRWYGGYRSKEGEFSAGDTLSFRTTVANMTLTGDGTQHYLNIIEQSTSEHIVTSLETVQISRAKNNIATGLATSTTYFIGYTTDFDSAGLFANSGSAASTTYTNTTYWTAPRSEKFRVSARIYNNDTDLDANEKIEFGIYVNGVLTRYGVHTALGTVAAPNNVYDISDIIPLVKDDKVSVAIWHNATGAIDLSSSNNYSWFTVEPTGKAASLAGLDHLKLVDCVAEFGFDQAFDKQIGDCLDPGNELTDSSMGVYVVNFKSGYWADVSCSIDTIDEVGGPEKECKRTTNAGTSQVTGVNVKCADVNTTTVFDEAFSVTCTGRKN